ncbi:MAG TPA: LPS export ABC transporter permease LptG [Terracidiphilus sp.]|nr:LPS export ABC transporter permease LptG [Terracidiphilus sp.]
MRTLTRYILGDILSHTLIGCALFTFIIFMPNLPRILEVVVRNSSTLTDMFEVILFTLPNVFKVTIPMAVLVGILLGLSRLAADSEIVAMRASGLGIGYFTRVASIVAVGGTLLGLANSLYLAPRANQAILALQHQLETSQASYEIQPQVFYEDFKNFVLYVQDVRSGVGAANWRKVFMANVEDPANPIVTTAETATVVSDSPQELLMRLRNGAEHEIVAGHPDQSKVTAFTSTEQALQLSAQGDVHLGRMDIAIYALPLEALLSRVHKGGADARRFVIELHNRFAYPAACLVLMLVGVPLGMASSRGGKSSGFVFALLLVSLYYLLSSIGLALGREDKVSAFLAVWSANLLFAAAGLFLVWQMATGGRVLNALVNWTVRGAKTIDGEANGNGLNQKKQSHGRLGEAAKSSAIRRPLLGRLRVRPLRTATGGTYPRLLDAYVVREFLKTFCLVLAGFILLMLVFTFFDLMSDILRNRIGLITVGDYLVNLTPSMLSQLAPLAVLIAVLVTFGVLNRNSEIVAMKATGISLYRLVIPIISIAAALAVTLFLFDQYYVPQANQRQEALRNIIKGRPAQTYLHPEQQWIFGERARGDPGRIFYYKFFDPVRNEFADLSVFEFDPSTFQLTRRIFAARVYWDDDSGSWRFQNGWVSDFSGADLTGFREFRATAFPEIHEDPAYFNVKEDLQAQEMNFGQLRNYIHDLQQSGFDTMRLRVALWHKLAYPLVAVVMAVLAIPFALSMGRRGSIAAIAVAIGVALTYWVVDSLLGDMGSVNYLPAVLAAWSSDVLFGLVGGYLLLRTPT